MEFIKDFTVTKGENSEVTIQGEIPFAELEKERAGALAKLGKDVEVDGFRKGHVPEHVLVERIGEGTILSEMAERAMARVYPEIIKTHEIEAIGYPQIQITKLAPENPLGFTATVAVMPNITLPEYKTLAAEVNKEKESTEVTDEDVEKQIKDIMRQKIAYERLQQKSQQNSEEKKDEDAAELPTPETVSKDDEPTDPAEIKDADLPELTDEYVKGLGQQGQFESVDDFKKKLREHIEIEKEREVNAAHRAKLTDKIIEESTLEVPKVMIDAELNQMFAQMEEDMKRANLTMDDYLNHIKKSKEDLVQEWTPAAKKRAQLQLILNEIAKKENVQPDEERLEQEVTQLKEHYKDADEAQIRTYVTSVLTNEATMQLLEAQ